MKLFDHLKLFSNEENPNSQYGINDQIQKRMMNGNAQFIVKLAKELQKILLEKQNFTSYSIVSLSCYLCHLFFIKKSFLNYDRFYIAVGCFLLALKLRDSSIGLKYVAPTFQRVINQIEGTHDMINDQKMSLIKDKICIAESKVIKTIEFDFDIKLGYDYIDYFNKFVEKEYQNKIFFTMKYLIFDLYRTYSVICFQPINITAAAFLMACHSNNYDILNENFTTQLVAKTLQINNTENITISIFFLAVQKEVTNPLILPAQINHEHVNQIIYSFNELMFINQSVEIYEKNKHLLVNKANQDNNNNENEELYNLQSTISNNNNQNNILENFKN